MNAYEKAVQESLENIQIKPNEALRNRVMDSAAVGVKDSRIFRRRIFTKATAAAAIIAVFLLTTAFAFGNEVITIGSGIINTLRQITFGNSTAGHVVYEHELQIGSWGVHNRTDLDDAKDYPTGTFDSIEKAREAAPFPINEPSFLPGNVIKRESIQVVRLEDPEYPWMHFVCFGYVFSHKDGISSLGLHQVYGGPDAYFKIENISPIEKVTVGNIEALLIRAPLKLIFDDGSVVIKDEDDYMSYELYWIKDEIAYILSVGPHSGYSIETIIKIAESIG